LLYMWSWAQVLGTSLRHRDEGASMVEYGLLVALIAVVAIVGVALLGPKLSDLFTDVANTIP